MRNGERRGKVFRAENSVFRIHLAGLLSDRLPSPRTVRRVSSHKSNLGFSKKTLPRLGHAALSDGAVIGCPGTTIPSNLTEFPSCHVTTNAN